MKGLAKLWCPAATIAVLNLVAALGVDPLRLYAALSSLWGATPG